MSAIGRRSRFLWTPHTGGSWITQVLRSDPNTKWAFFEPHVTLEQAPGSDLPTLAFVRNPFTWYKSFWHFNSQIPHKGGVNRKCKATKFNKFVDLMLEHHPGHCSEVFLQYVGEPEDDIVVGKQESLRRDLTDFLKRNYESHEMPELESQPRMRVSKYEAVSLGYTQEQIDMIILADAEVFERFGYKKEYNA
jgi:hypothetical protein